MATEANTLADQLRSLCAEHGLLNATIAFHADSARCGAFFSATLHIAGACETSNGDTPEAAIATALEKVAERRARTAAARPVFRAIDGGLAA